MKCLRWITRFSSFLWLVVPLLASAATESAAVKNSIETLQVSRSGGSTLLKIGLRNPLAVQPSNFSTANPARLVFDFPDTANGLGFSSKAVNEGTLRSLNVVQAGERSRLVLNLDKNPRFESRLEDKYLLITLTDEQTQSGSAGVVAGGQHFAPVGAKENASIRDIQFRRNKDGAGVVIVEMSSSDSGIDIKQVGGNLSVSFKKTQLPESLRRQMDVMDFATPVMSLKTRPVGEDVSLEIVPQGLWEHIAFQSDNQFIVEVKPVKADGDKLLQGTRGGYQGEAISLNFQKIPVRELLHVFADITNFNIVLSDTVSGDVSLRMNDVPWDQALELVLEQKNLAMRKRGNVLRIAPRDEIALYEKQELEAQQQKSALELPIVESFQINYQKAADIQKLLGNKDQPVLSKAGSVVVDDYTNRIFVTDVPSRLSKVRELINMIDQPVRQVLIEARVVEVRDNFGRELGVRLGLLNSKQTKVSPDTSANQIYFTGGASSIGTAGTGSLASSTFTQSSTMGQLSFSLFNAALTRILNVELRASEVDGRSKSLSNPRVVTGNNIKALIEQGDEIPVVTPGTGTNPPTTTYKKAKLSLEATPQITPDGRIKMKLVIAKDRPDFGRTVLGNPTIITAKVESEVMVENGGTLVVGGVSAEDNSEAEDRIPFFGDLPYVGFMFKHKNRTQEKKELLIFITPKIIEDSLSLR